MRNDQLNVPLIITDLAKIQSVTYPQEGKVQRKVCYNKQPCEKNQEFLAKQDSNEIIS